MAENGKIEISVREREWFASFTDPEIYEKIVSYPSVSAMWAHCISEYTSHPALCDENRKLTYAETEAAVAGFRTVLRRSCHAGARVAVLGRNSIDTAKAILAVTTLGDTAVPLPPHLDETRLAEICRMFSLSALVCTPETKEKAVNVSRVFGTAVIPAEEECDEKTPAAAVSEDTPCLIMLTGGTTGKSKGVLLSNRAVMAGVRNCVNGYATGTTSVFGQKVIQCLPMTHIYGLCTFVVALYCGSEIYMCSDAKELFTAAPRFEPALLCSVPALIETGLALSDADGKNRFGSRLKRVFCGGAAVSTTLVERCRRYGIQLVIGYGLTETTGGVTYNPKTDEKPDSAGFILPGTEARLVNGELWLRGRQIMDGYIGGDGTGLTDDGWFRTGDLARVDDDGYIYITGRIKDIIVLPNGENVSPAEVEEHFDALPFVAASQVFEDARSDGVHILALEVFPRDGYSEEEMMRGLRDVNDSLPGYQRVTRITFRHTDFERTENMKIVRYRK